MIVFILIDDHRVMIEKTIHLNYCYLNNVFDKFDF